MTPARGDRTVHAHDRRRALPRAGSLLLAPALLVLLAAAGARAADGLWVGTVRLDRVQYTQSAPDPAYAAIDPTPARLSLRLMLHAGSDGTVRLLKEVFQMWRPDDPATPGNEAGYVLLTDHALIPDYEGTSIRDGEQVGRRLSAVGFDFADHGGQYVECAGALAAGGTVTCSFTLGDEHPTNPFYHRPHPDHDNWDDRREKKVAESRTLLREITVACAAAAGDPSAPPGSGVTVLEATYRERLTGLARDPVVFGGPVTLQLTSDVAALNGGNE